MMLICHINGAQTMPKCSLSFAKILNIKHNRKTFRFFALNGTFIVTCQTDKASVLQPEAVAGQALDGVEVFEVEEHVGEGCGGKACLVGYLVGTEGVGGAECIDY